MGIGDAGHGDGNIRHGAVGDVVMRRVNEPGRVVIVLGEGRELGRERLLHRVFLRVDRFADTVGQPVAHIGCIGRLVTHELVAAVHIQVGVELIRAHIPADAAGDAARIPRGRQRHHNDAVLGHDLERVGREEGLVLEVRHPAEEAPAVAVAVRLGHQHRAVVGEGADMRLERHQVGDVVGLGAAEERVVMHESARTVKIDLPGEAAPEGDENAQKIDDREQRLYHVREPVPHEREERSQDRKDQQREPIRAGIDAHRAPGVLEERPVKALLCLRGELVHGVDAVEGIEAETAAAENPAEEPVDAAALVDESVADAEAGLDASAEASADEDMLEGQMSLEEMMAMAESLTNENGAAAESSSVDNAAAETAAESTAAEGVSDDTAVVMTEDEPAADTVSDAASDLAAEPVADAAASDAAAEPAVEAADVSAESIMADFNAEVASELQNEASATDAMAVSANSAVEPAVTADASEPATESADSEPAKEKKAKKTTRKKKAKADVSADIGAEDLAGRVFSDETAHLSDGMMIRGNIISDGNMEVAGEIDGNIDILGKLNVSGTINGNTKAGELYAEGAEINGNIECSGSVKVGQGAVIIGDVAGTSAVIAGAVKGNIDVHGPVILADSAIVMGDIRSASVQISNGAAVEGMCSQIYAEVSPKNFFKDLKKAK